MEQRETNLKFWRSLVGLPSGFPKLYPLAEKEILDLMVIDPERLSQIQQSMGTRQLTRVSVQPGWGLTTLFQYLWNELMENCLERLIIPIRIDLTVEPFLEEITLPGLQNEIKKQIIAILIEKPWECRLNNDYYFHCINFDEGSNLEVYKAKMRQLLFDKPPKPRALVAQFPWLKDSLQDLFNYQLVNLRIQTVLFYHFPRKMEEQRILDLVSSLKAIFEISRFEFAAIREIYFCTPSVATDLDREFKRPFSSIKYPVYTAAQIYAMLVKRYSPYVPGAKGRNTVTLNSVFSEEFVIRAWESKMTLGGIVDKIQQEMYARLDCAKNKVAFFLKPVETLEQGQSDDARSETEQKNN